MADATVENLRVGEPDEQSELPTPSTRRRHSAREPLSARIRWATPWLAMLIVAGAIAPFRDRWAVQLLLLAWILVAPGRLALAAMRVRSVQVRQFPVYIAAMSILFVMIVGLAVDAFGLLLGNDHPLRTATLWVGVAIGYVLLVVFAAVAAPDSRPDLTPPPVLLTHSVLLLPLLAAVGAARLNAGHGSTVAVLAMSLMVVVLLVRPLLPHFTWRAASVTIYSIALAGMWSFSLRGDSVYGYDVVTEYKIATQTASSGVWHLRHPGDAYGSLLSVSILPTSLHGIVGMSVLMLFKLLLPALASLLPAAIVALSGRLLTVRWSYVAAGFAVGQVYLVAGLPSLTRQAFAFLFVACLLMAAMELRRKSGFGTPVLVGLCGVGMVWSHYSTAYMAIAGFLIAAVLGACVWPFTKPHRTPVAALTLVTLGLILTSLLWYGGLTESSSNVTSTATSITRDGLRFIPNREGNVLGTLLRGNVAQPVTAKAYEQGVAEQYAKSFPSVKPVADADSFHLQPLPPAPVSSLTNATAGAVAVIGQLLNALAILGCVFLVIARRRAGVAVQTIGLVGLGTAAFLLLVRLSGTLAQAYNLERAQLQGLIVLAPIATYALATATQAVRDRVTGGRTLSKLAPRLPTLVSMAALVFAALLIVNSSGLISAGSGRNERANISSGSLEASRFAPRSGDLQAARWLLSENPHARELTYGDVYGRLRLWSAGGIGGEIYSDVTPRTLQPRAWVYVYSANEGRDGVAQAAFNGGTVSYRFPSRFVSTYYDRVYVNGSAEVYK